MVNAPHVLFSNEYVVGRFRFVRKGGVQIAHRQVWRFDDEIAARCHTSPLRVTSPEPYNLTMSITLYYKVKAAIG